MTFRRISAWLVLGLCSAAVLSGGCEKKKPPPPPVNPNPEPVAPPPPEPVDVQALMQAMGASGVIQFPAHLAPTSENLARAVIAFCDAFARGDDAAVSMMLDDSGQEALNALLDDGKWEEATGKIEALRLIQFTQMDESGVFTFAIQEPGKAYLLAWSVAGFGSSYIFSAQESPNVSLTRASEFDSFVPTPADEGEPELPEDEGPAPGDSSPPSDPATPPGRGNSPGIG